MILSSITKQIFHKAIESTREMYHELIKVSYDANQYAFPQRRRKHRSRQSKPNLADYSVIGNGVYAPDDSFMDEESIFAITKVDEQNLTPGKVSHLTEPDIEVLSERGLNLDKARVLKPYWAKGLSRNATSSMLSRSNGQRVSGFSASTVGSIFAAFSTALSESENATP